VIISEILRAAAPASRCDRDAEPQALQAVRPLRMKSSPADRAAECKDTTLPAAFRRRKFGGGEQK